MASTQTFNRSLAQGITRPPPVPVYATAERPGQHRLLLISYHFPPDPAVGALRWQKLARYAAERGWGLDVMRSEEHTSELQSRLHLVCRLLLEKKKKSTRH